MAAHGLRARWRRKFTHTTDIRHGLAVAHNVLQRQFKPHKPYQTCARDITYVRTRGGWLQLAVVLDLFSRKVVGWATAPSMPAQLVCEALRMAITSRRPNQDCWFIRTEAVSTPASCTWGCCRAMAWCAA